MISDKKLPVTDLYIAPIPDAPAAKVFQPARQALIDATASEAMRRQRYYVWKLLEYALGNSFGLQPESVQFFVDENGKWSCPDCYFSLSHSKYAVAVAVSSSPVGVDIESPDRAVTPRLPHKVLTDTELEAYALLDEGQQRRYLLEKWCTKESLFKSRGGKQFLPRQIEANTGVCTGIAHIIDQPVLYAVASEQLECLKIFTDIKL